ncbi:MAG: DUF3079 domain-containing protein [Polyangiaceae bacterium]
MTRFPEHPAHPERICWGCDKMCPARDSSCGNGTERTPHPEELFGSDWRSWFDSQLEHSQLEHSPVLPVFRGAQAK